MTPALALLLLAPVCRAAVVNDVSGLNPVAVERVVSPASAPEVARLVRESAGPIAIGGARHSMGGQIAEDGALFLDMRSMDRVLAYSPKDRTIKVEAGITWRKIQETIDPDGLSVKIMQTYANFTVGGSLSVNAHGRYVDQGPLVYSVKAIELVLADGRLVEATPNKNAEIYYGAIGGYGGLGVIVSATLELDENTRLERRSKMMPVSRYAAFFDHEVLGSKAAVFHNGDLYPPAYDTVRATTFYRTARAVTVKDRLVPAGRSYWREKLAYFWISELPGGKWIREWLLDPWRRRDGVVVWRNYEASYDAAELEPLTRRFSTYVLQEYFVPVRRFDEFVPKLREIFQRRRVNALNVSIRHARHDPGTLLAWAREDCFAFVVYYKQGTSAEAMGEVSAWTRELLKAVASVGGSYYLPYEVIAPVDDFHKFYPRAKEFLALKRKLDPSWKFRNKLWDRYLPAPR